MLITAQFDSIADLREFCNAFIGQAAIGPSTASEARPHPEKIAAALTEKTVKEVAQQAGTAKAEAVKPEKPKAEDKKPEPVKDEGDPAKAAFEEAKTLIPALTKIKGRGHVEQILKEGFGAARLGEVASDRLVDLVDVLKKSLPQAE